MAELAALGIVANVFAVVDFGVKVLKRLEEYRAAVDELPKTFHDASIQVGLLVGYINDIQEADRSGALSRAMAKRLRPAILECDKMVKQLDDVLAKTLPEPNSSRTQRKLKALGSLRYDGKVEKIMKTLDRYMSTLTMQNALSNHVSQGPRPNPKPLSTVPKRRDPNWIDRPTITTQIEDKCGEPAARVALVGIGGIGKSQLAIDYSHRLRLKAPDTWVFWVHAATLDNIEKGFRDIAEKAHIPGWHAGDPDRFKTVSNWLSDESNGRWLMIIDNADDLDKFVPEPPVVGKQKHKMSVSAERPAEDLRNHLPESANGSYLITSRDKNVVHQLAVNHKDIIPVEPMNKASSIELFKNILTDTAPDSDIAALVDALGYIPLAMTQAASAINIDWPRETVPKYLAKIQKGDEIRAKLLEENVYDARRDGTRSNSVIATWHISFERIRHLRPSAARLLSLMSLFNRQGIPENLLVDKYTKPVFDTRRWWKKEVRRWKSKRKSKQNDRIETSDENFDEDWRVLTSFSLIATDMDGEHFGMHGLVQFSTKRWLEVHQELETWIDRYIWVIHDAFPEDPYDFEPETIFALIPHTHAAFAALREPRCKDTFCMFANLLYKEGNYALSVESNEHAERMLRSALRAFNVVPDINETYVLTTTMKLGECMRALHKYEEAEDFYRKAWKLSEKLYGVNDDSTQAVVGWIKQCLQHQRKYGEVEKMFDKELQASVDLDGVGNERSLVLMGQHAHNLWSWGRYDDADRLQRRMFEIRKQKYGEEYPRQWADARYHAALAMALKGRFKEAETVHREILDVREKALGPDASETIDSVGQLGWVLMQQQSYDGAEKYLRRAVAYLATCQKKLDSDYVFHLKAQLALVLVKQQKCKEAETLSRNMLQDSEEEHGKDHHNIACAADLLGKALYHQQQYKEALDLFERAHALVQIEIGDDAPDTKDFLQDCLLAREALAREAEALAKSAKRAEPIPASKKAPTIAVIPTHNWSARKATSGFKAELKSSLYRYLQPKPMIYQRPKSSASCRSFQHSNLNYQLSAPELPLVG